MTHNQHEEYVVRTGSCQDRYDVHIFLDRKPNSKCMCKKYTFAQRQKMSADENARHMERHGMWSDRDER